MAHTLYLFLQNSGEISVFYIIEGYMCHLIRPYEESANSISPKNTHASLFVCSWYANEEGINLKQVCSFSVQKETLHIKNILIVFKFDLKNV